LSAGFALPYEVGDGKRTLSVFPGTTVLPEASDPGLPHGGGLEKF